jgi:hypothetical protein
MSIDNESGPLDAGELKTSGAFRARLEEEREAMKPAKGHALRNKGRSHVLSTKIRPETYQLILALGTVERKSIVEVLEAALAEYAKGRL